MSNNQHFTSTHSWPVVGHEWAVHLLQRALVDGQNHTDDKAGGPRHAYLFLGTPQVGKTTLVHAFAQALLCAGIQHDFQNNGAVDSRPCGQCRACRLMGQGTHPDFRLVQPLDKAGQVDRMDGTLRTEQVADIIRETVLSPIESRYKIFIIQDVHTANDSFSNKLLKTLEEPPEPVILCLTASDRSQVLPTIVSRCQILELRPLNIQTIEEVLQRRWQADADHAHLLARLANGRLGWAVQQLNNPDDLTSRKEQLVQLWHLTRSDRVVRLEFAERLASNRDNQQLFSMLALWSGWWRDVMLTQAGCLDACSNIDYAAELTQHAEALPAQIVQRYLHTLQRVESYLHHTVNLRLALDVLLLRLPQV